MTKEKLMKFKRLFNLMLEKYALEGVHEEINLERGDQVDLITSERDKALVLKLRKRKEIFVRKINKALSKIEKGSFGECQECGEEIETKRLIARPTASMCIRCKEEHEREEDQLSYQKRSHTLGKEIINDNVIELPRNGDISLDEKILKFNRRRLGGQIVQSGL